MRRARGADVVGIDFAPALVETAKRQAAEAGLEIDYRVGDAENLELEDASFDIVTSTFGVMFAPDQARAAAELARVTRPGGRLALATWMPDGGIGEMFRMTAPFQPPPPEGAGAPLDWGRPEHVEELLGDAFELVVRDRTSIDEERERRGATGSCSSTNFGPVKTLAESLDDDRREEFHRAWVEFFEPNYRVGRRDRAPARVPARHRHAPLDLSDTGHGSPRGERAVRSLASSSPSRSRSSAGSRSPGSGACAAA